MEGAKLASRSSRAELVVVAGSVVTMVLSCVCVVVLCAVANEASGTAAKVTYAAPSASAAGDIGAPGGVAVISLR